MSYIGLRVKVSKTDYKKFKKQVLENADGRCESPHCDADADQVHHFFKTSTYPEYKIDPDNGMACDGACHSEIERRLREGENWEELVPMDRYRKMEEKVNGTN